MALRNSLSIAIKALRKNKLQTALTMIGMTIGVATVLTMIALGSGAQTAIQDQVRSAGMNLIVVKSGNYAVKLELGTADSVQGPSAAAYIPSTKKLSYRTAVWDPRNHATLTRVEGQ